MDRIKPLTSAERAGDAQCLESNADEKRTSRQMHFRSQQAPVSVTNSLFCSGNRRLDCQAYGHFPGAETSNSAKFPLSRSDVELLDQPFAGLGFVLFDLRQIARHRAVQSSGGSHKRGEVSADLARLPSSRSRRASPPGQLEFDEQWRHQRAIRRCPKGALKRTRGCPCNLAKSPCISRNCRERRVGFGVFQRRLDRSFRRCQCLR
jgi:hypothetical protein